MMEKKAKVGRKPKYDYESEEFLKSIYDLAFKGYNDKEIAQKIGLSAEKFYTKKGELSKLSNTLDDARTHAREKLNEVPSAALFSEICDKFSADRYRIAKYFGVSWNTVKVWMRENEEFQNVFDDANLKFISNINATGRILAQGIAEKDEKGNFKGWIERPDSNMNRFYLQTVGRNYGFGDNIDVTTNGNDIKGSISVEEWIKAKNK